MLNQPWVPPPWRLWGFIEVDKGDPETTKKLELAPGLPRRVGLQESPGKGLLELILAKIGRDGKVDGCYGGIIKIDNTGNTKKKSLDDE